ncbi:MAG: non-hydrolyzing UDP-N-acetylglucosamine 2-epimerase [Rhodothermales bacterium]
MKMAPIVHELRRRDLPQLLVHTGQHYDARMSQSFFIDLGLPEPDVYLDVGSDTHARQTARIMTAFEQVCLRQCPDLVMVGGDVNSTLAASLVASKLHIPIAHVEAGLRSFDRRMPEEVNRVVTDHLSELLFTTEPSGNENLRVEGVASERIHFVGNCMIDTLLKHVDECIDTAPWAKRFDLEPFSYGLLTLHRPSNVDEEATLAKLIRIVQSLGKVPIIFPVHPRTWERLARTGIELQAPIRPCEPLPYKTFLGLQARAKFVLTDSGGIQEETTALGIPCLTLRSHTERPVTIEEGTNCLVGTDPRQIRKQIDSIVAGSWKKGKKPHLWDGQSALRIVDVVENWSASLSS